ncbi:radical SAM family heme chaperone HemW [Acetobacterium woodii]|uniref:Heme chaperone HemW n=1 Tax=Acetobacterium woodii (strain ATCC 29683 / DSM 1030 / JCM 2381 / KCTC 1655 / WB1) TaxID=931626 RepID=H6LFD2_ACEWD|nr:radical SAM family heme chaperone HemW [Acetobacterium woodii]AFA49419.1 oxygen-independent coproporphyrinogen-III oxidase 1 [Acetobacterium woodii DSM 1030]
MNTIKIKAAKRLGIYCHIPFCLKKCAYCDFSSFACQEEGIITAYFKDLQQEIKNFVKKNSAADILAVDTIYFGGGTPSSVKVTHIEAIMALFKEVFVICDDAEVTIEINPGTLTAEKAGRYKKAGINRVSVGLQAWQDDLLKMLGRVHNQADFITAMKLLKAAGFENISVDVMYGLPGQKLVDVLETVTELMAFGPTHLSCYSLILEENTKLEKLIASGQLKLPDEDQEREMHWAIDAYLNDHGYQHYEISSYCKPGYESKHNLKYWELVPYLGFGLGAHGYYNGQRYGNTNALKSYSDLITAGKLPGIVEPEMKPAVMMSEWMFLGLRKLNGIRDQEFKACFGKSFFTEYQKVIDSLIEENLLEWDGVVLKLTPTGQDFGNRVFMAFI